MEQAPRQPVPIFPLPDTVLFPQAVLPLHVFELRYRTMVRDALSGERLIVIALLKPGWERDYLGSPEYFPLGCLARFEEVEWLPDDRYHLRLLGLARVRLRDPVRDYLYRAAPVDLLPEAPYPEDDPLVVMEKQALLAACARLSAAVPPEQRAPVPGPGLPYVTLVNAVCTGLALDPLEKLALLELDSVIERGRRLRTLLENLLVPPPEPGAPGGEHN